MARKSREGEAEEDKRMDRDLNPKRLLLLS